MRNISKSKILSSLQCKKKLWLEIHHKELAVEPEMRQKNFDIGNQVGDISRQIYDPDGVGQLIDPFANGLEAAIKKTQTLLQDNKPIFEAAFSIDGGLVLTDVLLPLPNSNAWRMIEIKSSTDVKDYHLDDVAVQHYVTKMSGLNLTAISLGHIDNQWVYQGDDDYSGLIKEVDLTDHANGHSELVKNWFGRAQSIAAMDAEPDIAIGEQCAKPFDCPFLTYCSKGLPTAKHPVSWLPRIQKKTLKEYIKNNNVIDMAEVPDDLLNEKQRRVKKHTLTDTVYFNQEATNKTLSEYDHPQYFLDFETINLAVPRWKGTRAYQQIPFQFSLHYLEGPADDLEHVEFLDVSGADPSLPFAEALISVCGTRGPIFVYNIGFESTRIKELAARFPEHEPNLMAINVRLVDLWPLAKEHYYNPSQRGSWSIKSVLPAISDQFDYDELDGVKDGGMAMDAYAKTIDSQTSAEEKEALRQQLLKYCEMDTLAMVEIFKYFLIGPIAVDDSWAVRDARKKD